MLVQVEVTIQYFKTKDVEHNWHVFMAGQHVGYLHYLDGIGGSVLDEKFMNSPEFDKVCQMAEEDYELNRLYNNQGGTECGKKPR